MPTKKPSKPTIKKPVKTPSKTPFNDKRHMMAKAPAGMSGGMKSKKGKC